MQKLTNCIADERGVQHIQIRDTQGLYRPKKRQKINYCITKCMKVTAYLGDSSDSLCISCESRDRDNLSVDFMGPNLFTGYKFFGLDDCTLLSQYERQLRLNI